MVSKKLIRVGEVVRGQENSRLLRWTDFVSLGEFYAKRLCILTGSQIIPWRLLKLEYLLSPSSLVPKLPVQSRSEY